MSGTVDAIVISKRDNVGVALHTVRANSIVRVAIEDRIIPQKVGQDVPTGHKFALAPIHEGEEIIKYGEAIGRASRPILAGEHVHVHNVESRRGRGDLKDQ